MTINLIEASNPPDPFEFEVIDEMVRACDENGLLVEVIYEFYKLAKDGRPIEECAACALAEWDI